MGNATTIEYWKCKFYCREVLLSLRRLLLKNQSLFAPPQTCPKLQRPVCDCIGVTHNAIWTASGNLAHCKSAPTPATLQPEKNTLHKFLCLELISRKITFQLQENIYSGINFPKITYHVFVCDSENYMEKRFGNYFLENLISVTWNNVFGINFAIISGWSVLTESDWEVLRREQWWQPDNSQRNLE